MEWLRRRANPVDLAEKYAPYTLLESERLATYNAEVARGIVHTPEYDARMAEVQERYNRWLHAEWEVPK